MQKIVILFDGPHLAFSPTPAQLYDELSKKYEVTIIAQNPKNYTGQAIEDRRVLYHKYYAVKGRVVYKILFKALTFINREARCFQKHKLNYRDYFFKYQFFKRALKKTNYARVICIDIANLFFCSLLNQKVDFLSLELTKDEHLLPAINKDIIECILIQSRPRLEYLFKDVEIKTFYVQNAPEYKEMEIDVQARDQIIYSGSSIDGLGFYHCLNYLNKYPGETMMVQGAFYQKDKERVEKEYSNLLKEQRLLINSNYLDNNDVVKFIANYQVGFCFYNFNDPFIKSNYFNYFSAPSGKMFKYLAAGVPVVCSDILGFQFVKEYQCGILIEGLGEEEIRKAVMTIRSNYLFYVENAKTAAKFFSFDKAILPYLEFISDNINR